MPGEESCYLCGGVAEALLNWGQVVAFPVWVASVPLHCSECIVLGQAPELETAWRSQGPRAHYFPVPASPVSSVKGKHIPQRGWGYFNRTVSRGLQSPSSFGAGPIKERLVRSSFLTDAIRPCLSCVLRGLFHLYHSWPRCTVELCRLKKPSAQSSHRPHLTKAPFPAPIPPELSLCSQN